MKKGIIIAILFCSIITCSKVKASSWESVWIAPTVKYQINNGSWYNTSVSTDNYHTIYSVTGSAKYRFQFTSQKELTSSQEMLYFTTKISYDPQHEYITDQDQVCTKWTQNGNNYTCTEYAYGPLTQQVIPYDKAFSITFSYRYNVNGTVYYKQCLPVANAGNSFTFRCPNTSNAVDGVEVSVFDNYNTIGTYSVGVYYLYNIEKSDTQSIIDNQNNNTQEILESNTTYENNATESFTNETQQINDYEQAETNLLNNLDFSAVNETISINPNASQFIWNIVEGLRSMNGAIILLMSSIFSIGLIKLILNR